MTRPAGSASKTPRVASASGKHPEEAGRGGRSRGGQPPTAEPIRRVLREHLAESAALLGEAAATPRETVHGFRKLMKRVRATLRLLSEADHLDLRFLEDTCRDVARRFSVLRDLDVMIATVAAR